jgi:hypothetical protein
MQKMRTFKSSPVAWRMCLALVANMALGKQAWQSVVCQSLGEPRQVLCRNTKNKMPTDPGGPPPGPCPIPP